MDIYVMIDLVLEIYPSDVQNWYQPWINQKREWLTRASSVTSGIIIFQQ